MKSELKNRFGVENTRWDTGRNGGPASQATHTLAKVSAPSLEDRAAGLRLQIEFPSRKQALRRRASRNLPGGLWKPHQVRGSCDVLCTVPHGDPTPGAGRLHSCPKRGQSLGPGHAPERGLASGMQLFGIRTGLGRELSTALSALPEGSRGSILKRRWRSGRRNAVPTWWSSPTQGSLPMVGQWMLKCQAQWGKITPDDGGERIRALRRYLTGMLKETWIKSWSVWPLPRKTLTNMAEWYS